MSVWRGQPKPRFDSAGAWPLGTNISLAAAHSFAHETDVLSYHRNPLESQRYGRDSSLSAAYVEEWMSNLYEEKCAFLFPSGMAAISSCLQLAPEGSRHIFLTRENYRKTLSLAKREASALTQFSGAAHLREEMAKCTCQKRVLLVESPANPHLRLVNLVALAEVAREHDALCVWDATFAGLDNAVEAISAYDLVVHSATKYIAGHDDVVAGVLFAESALAEDVFDLRSQFSSVLDPTSSSLLARSLMTYDVRLDRMVSNARSVVDFLAQMMKEGPVLKIWYPGEFENADQSELATETLQHRGAVVSFEVRQGLVNGFRDATVCRVARLAPSFGSVRTLFEVPATMSHGGKTRPEVLEMGIELGLVRLSVGIEPVEAILDDLNALLR